MLSIGTLLSCCRGTFIVRYFVSMLNSFLQLWGQAVLPDPNIYYRTRIKSNSPGDCWLPGRGPAEPLFLPKAKTQTGLVTRPGKGKSFVQPDKDSFFSVKSALQGESRDFISPTPTAWSSLCGKKIVEKKNKARQNGYPAL